MSAPYSSTLFRLTYWHESGTDCPCTEDTDCDAPQELTLRDVASIAVDEMARNPYAVYCRRRGCGHRGNEHESAGCTAEGCECEGLKQ